MMSVPQAKCSSALVLRATAVKDCSLSFRRGYWDDLWCRLRSNDDNEARVSRRGYVEVIIDGWHS